MDNALSIILWIIITPAVYFTAQWGYIKLRLLLLHPVLVSIFLIIFLLYHFDVDYEQYNLGGRYISFFLGPSVVALGVLLHEKFDVIKKRATAISISLLSGGLSGIISVILMAWALHANPEIIASLAPKSVTTPIAIVISERAGGIPSLTAVIVILVGVFGAAFGPIFLKYSGIKDKIAFGLAMGTASHGIGTARAIEEGRLEGAASGLAMCLNGIITALATPYILEAMNLLWAS